MKEIANTLAEYDALLAPLWSNPLSGEVVDVSRVEQVFTRLDDAGTGRHRAVPQAPGAVRGMSSPYILLLTARDRTTDIIQGVQAGADDYITKPLVQEDLLTRIQVGEQLLTLH